LIAVNHLMGHALNRAPDARRGISPSCCCLCRVAIASLSAWGRGRWTSRLYGSTIDDAVGEALRQDSEDFWACPIPVGPAVEAAAKRPAIRVPYNLPRGPMKRTSRPRIFPFSGLKTALPSNWRRNPIRRPRRQARVFRAAVIDILCDRSPHCHGDGSPRFSRCEYIGGGRRPLAANQSDWRRLGQAMQEGGLCHPHFHPPGFAPTMRR